MNGVRDEIRIKILFFAKARELAGCKEVEVNFPIEISSTELKSRIV